MEHTRMESLRRRDRRVRRARHACPDGLVDLVLDRRDGAFAHLMAEQPGALLHQRVATDPLALDRGLVAIAPVPVLAGPDMLEVTAALDVEERRATVAMRPGGGAA